VLFDGVEIDDHLVLLLAGAMQRSALSQKLHVSATLRRPVVNLTGVERHKVLSLLDESPAGLEGLRERLVSGGSAWRLR